MNTFTPLTLLPLIATIVGAVFAAFLLNRYFTGKRRPHELIWGVAFLMFAIAGACQVYVDITGTWSDFTARTYYLFGATLNVALLGLGTIYLIMRGRVATVALGIVIAFSLVAAIILFTVPVDASKLHNVASGYTAVKANSFLPPLMAALSNSIGTLIVVGGALWSAYIFWRKRIMKERMIGVLLIALGTFIVAIGGSLTGLTGNPDFNYLPMAIGVTVMFVGYLQSIRVSMPQAQPQAQAAEPRPAATPTSVQ
jgi:hypothetical protein